MHQNQCGGRALQSRCGGALVERAQAQSRGRPTSESCPARSTRRLYSGLVLGIVDENADVKVFEARKTLFRYTWRPRPASRQCKRPRRAQSRSRNAQPPSDFGLFTRSFGALLLECVRPSRQEAALYLRRCALRDDKTRKFTICRCANKVPIKTAKSAHSVGCRGFLAHSRITVDLAS